MGCRLEKWRREWPEQHIAALKWCACRYHNVYHTPNGDIPIPKEKDNDTIKN